MKYTLLDLAQTILSSIDGDEVNSINDTVEAQQVVKIIQTAYFEIVNRSNLPENYSLVNLIASTDTTQPTVMFVPDNVAEICWVKYDKHTLTDTTLTMGPVHWQELPDFLHDMYMRDTTDTTINYSYVLMDGSNQTNIISRKDKSPDFYTSFNDKTLLFDSFDLAVDTTLQSSKSLAYARLNPAWSAVDNFIPVLDDPQFLLLINEAKSLAWAELKQASHAKAEQSAKRDWSNLAHTKYRGDKYVPLNHVPNYGRK